MSRAEPERRWGPRTHRLQVPTPVSKLLDVFGPWGQIHLHGDPKVRPRCGVPGPLSAPWWRGQEVPGGADGARPGTSGSGPPAGSSPCNLTAHASPSAGLTCLPCPFLAPSHPEGHHAPMCTVSPAVTPNLCRQCSRTALPGTQKCAQRQGLRPRRTDS